jgi:hypothetical protein
MAKNFRRLPLLIGAGFSPPRHHNPRWSLVYGKGDREGAASQSLEDFCKAYLKRSETGERAAYIAAIRAISVALWVRIPEPGPLGERCFLWFEELANQLEDLGDGIVSATLDCPVRKKGLSSSVWMERSTAAGIVEWLHYQHGMKYEAAARHLVSQWKNSREWTVLKEDTSEKDLLSWLGEFRKGRVADPAAVKNYERWEYDSRTGKFNSKTGEFKERDKKKSME